jgi:ribosomal protein S18 acetylase RimI-like enzyme
MKLELHSVLEHGIARSLEVLNLGFSDYLVPIRLDLVQFHEMLRSNNIDVNLSQVVFKDATPVGVALIARRGWSCRLAGMCIIPQARGQKVGLWMMEQLIEHAITREDKRMELEVIAQNEPAVKLYQKVGFTKIRELLGFKMKSPKGETGDLQEIDIRYLASLVSNFGLPKLPWQVSGESLATIGPPHRAYRLNSAFVAISNPEADQVLLHSILTMPDSRGQGQASFLMRVLSAQFPQKTWVVRAIFPGEMKNFFESLGFERQELSQFQMELIFE